MKVRDIGHCRFEEMERERKKHYKREGLDLNPHFSPEPIIHCAYLHISVRFIEVFVVTVIDVQVIRLALNLLQKNSHIIISGVYRRQLSGIMLLSRSKPVHHAVRNVWRSTINYCVSRRNWVHMRFMLARSSETRKLKESATSRNNMLISSLQEPLLMSHIARFVLFGVLLFFSRYRFRIFK